MTNLLKEIMNIINPDIVFGTGLMMLVFIAARKRGIEQKRKQIQLRKEEPKVVGW